MEANYYKKYEPFFGSWYIYREIGAGSFGRVFEIRREDFGKTYRAALKAISIPATETELKSLLSDGMDEASVASYYQSLTESVSGEFAIMSDLKGNSNIVCYEDHVVIPWENGIGYDILIRMELLTPLPDYIAENGFSTKDVIRLGIDVCRALELCQRRDIIHRDIKPSNIFVSDNGDYKLGDFGVARTMEQTIGGMSQKGTYTYMAPEVYRGEHYDGRADIYSLGIVLYRLLNENRQPFLPLPPEPITFEAQQRAQHRMYTGDIIPEPINSSAELTALLRKACALRAEERFSGPGELRQALEEALHSTKDAVVLQAKESKTAADRDLEITQTVSVFGAGAPAESLIDEDSMVQETVGIDWSSKGRKTELAAPRKKTKALEPEKKNGAKKLVGIVAGVALALLAIIGIYIYSVYNETETIYAPVSVTWALSKDNYSSLYDPSHYSWEYCYDKYGRIDEIVTYNKNNIEMTRCKYSYREDGKPISRKEYRAGTEELIETIEYAYYPDGNLAVWTRQDEESFYEYRYSYDVQGRPIENICYIDAEFEYCRRYTYHDEDLVPNVVIEFYDKYGNPKYAGCYQWDLDSRAVGLPSQRLSLDEGASALDCYDSITWLYDDEGRVSVAYRYLYGNEYERYEYVYGEIEVLKRENISEQAIDRAVFWVEASIRWWCPEWVENLWIGGK